MNLHVHRWSYTPAGKDVIRTCKTCGKEQILFLKEGKLHSVKIPFITKRLYFGFGYTRNKWEDIPEGYFESEDDESENECRNCDGCCAECSGGEGSDENI